MYISRLMATTAKEMNKKRRFIGVPLVTPALSRLWFCCNRRPEGLVIIISSLRYEMIARGPEPTPREPQTSVRDTLRQALKKFQKPTDLAPFAPQPEASPRCCLCSGCSSRQGRTQTGRPTNTFDGSPPRPAGSYPAYLGRNGVLSFKLFMRGPSCSHCSEPNASVRSFVSWTGSARESPRTS